MNILQTLGRQGYCTIYLSKVMPFAVSKLLISNFVSEMNITKILVSDIKNQILNEFKYRFSDENSKNDDWMDKKSKKSALLKANNMESFIGYDNFLFNETFMNHLYNVISFLAFRLFEYEFY